MSIDISEEPRQHSSIGDAPLLGEDSARDPETASSIGRSESDEEEWADEHDSSPYNWHKSGPNDDNFEVLLAPLLDRDTKQCNVWKEEVQNILIFAGLFSAVVTAFIIESYQRLQPNPNDQIMSLLSRIADQMNTPTGNTSLSATLAPTSPGFIPSSSDIRVNIFWFISLVLSLTAALIGIITLQWLREHQRYESGIAASRIFATFNARSVGLKRWYVPQIFTGLPLLLQAALVSFFAGLVEFLFATRIEVAIPVALAVVIPILFLVMTTILPTLQLYAMHIPYYLSLNYGVPAPCPYKSPQALIFQRGAVISSVLFRSFAWAFAVLWLPIVSIARVFAESDKSFYGISSPFAWDNYHMQYFHERLRKAAGNWMSMDMEWLGARTSYALAIQNRPCYPHLPWPYHDSHGKLSGIVGFYDSINGIKSIANNSALTSEIYRSALRTCMRMVVLDLSTGLADCPRDQDSRELQTHITDLMHIIGPHGHPQTERLVKQSRGDFDVISNAFLAVLMDQAMGYDGSVLDFQHPITHERLETHMQLARLYLLHNAHELFLCSYRPGIIPSFTQQPRHSTPQLRSYLERHNPSWMKYMSRRWTRTLKSVIMDALKMIPFQTYVFNCPGSLPTPCGNNIHFRSIIELTEYILLFQISEDIRDTLRLLHNLTTTGTSPIDDRPFVLIIACVYVDAVARANQHKVVDQEFQTLLHAICFYHFNLSPKLYKDFLGDGQRWDTMTLALGWIRDKQADKQRRAETNEIRRLLRLRQYWVADNVSYSRPEQGELTASS